MSDMLFEQYEGFLREHSNDIATPSGALKMITDEGMFRAYMDALTEGCDVDVRSKVMAVANRNREQILTEAANVPTSSFATGWTVLSFPILVDIYSEPIIAELCNVYPVSGPIISVPRIKIRAEVKSYDGNTTTSYSIPSSGDLVRPNTIESNITPGTNTNLFTAAGVSSDDFKMNRRYTFVNKIKVTETAGDSSTAEHEIDVTFKPDNRSQFVGEFSFVESATGSTDEATITCSYTGHINYDTGIISFQIIFSSGTSGTTYVCNYSTISMRFVPTHTMNGRTKVIIEVENIDLTIDGQEDFLIDLPIEDVQDFKAIFKIDLVRTISEAIKRQILLNKDSDISFFLQSVEGEMATNNTAQTVDLAAYSSQAGAGEYTPATVTDVLKAILPRISIIMSRIRKSFNMYPTIAVSGLRTTALLRSLQDMTANIPNLRGEIGWSGTTSQFMKLKILESSVIPDNKIYFTTKAPSNALEKSTIVDFIYNPLYIVQEITDGNTRNFVRSRTSIEILRTDGLGVLTVNNMDDYVGV